MGNEQAPRIVDSGALATKPSGTRNLSNLAPSGSSDEAGRGEDRDDLRRRYRPGVTSPDESRAGRPEGVLRSDATCTMAWRSDRYEAIQVFVDPALRDRADELCAAIEGWSGVHRRLDDLSAEILGYADHEDLSVTIDPQPRDDLSSGLVAIAITLG